MRLRDDESNNGKSSFSLALEDAVGKTRANMERFGERFPNVSSNGKYDCIGNASWTCGFWSGMLWLAYSQSGDEAFREAARRTVDSFRSRLEGRMALQHHDIGFLYSLSSKAQWITERDPAARELTLRAADVLMERWRPAAGVFQAWGAQGEEKNGGRIIIDSLMNMPLLYWASLQTGEEHYRHAARRHTELSRRYLVRGDDSSYHTFFFDRENGEPVRGATHQGYADGSTWTRGQAWGIYGFSLAYRYTGEPGFLDTARGMARYFMQRLPPDGVVYWDFDAPQAAGTPRDSSANAIAACGMLELAGHLQEGDERREMDEGARQLLAALIGNCSTMGEEAEGLLRHGSYSVRAGRNPDDYMIWGDYFYMEALMRLTKGHCGYWYESLVNP
ncbi:MAG: glycosyl hydrolase family 88 [Paenibacillaceae bacterium]|nr:glycosyl hydrolase family 88 [Paenibacillaceae bacterium]